VQAVVDLTSKLVAAEVRAAHGHCGLGGGLTTAVHSSASASASGRPRPSGSGSGIGGTGSDSDTSGGDNSGGDSSGGGGGGGGSSGGGSDGSDGSGSKVGNCRVLLADVRKHRDALIRRQGELHQYLIEVVNSGAVYYKIW
jgi:hypothetical protein